MNNTLVLLVYSLGLGKNKTVTLEKFSENFEEDKTKILAAAENLFSIGAVLLEKEEKPFSLQRVFLDNTEYHYPLRTEYAPVEIKDIGGKISVSVVGSFSIDIPKV